MGLTTSWLLGQKPKIGHLRNDAYSDLFRTFGLRLFKREMGNWECPPH